MLEKKISRRNMLRATGLAVLGSTFAGLASCAPKKKEEPSPEASSSKRPFQLTPECLISSPLLYERIHITGP